MAVLGFGKRLARNRHGVAYDRSITVLGGGRLADPFYGASR
jgi:hypothetical protein